MAPVFVDSPQLVSSDAPKVTTKAGLSGHDSSAMEFPPWRQVLEDTIRKNYQGRFGDVKVSLATMRPFGRPANRVVQFTGFMSDHPSSQPERQTSQPSLETSRPSGKIGQELSSFLATLMASSEYINMMSNLGQRSESIPKTQIHETLVFATDVRSKVIEDALFGCRFGEVCWVMPKTADEFRLSGTMHVILPPSHPMHASCKLPDHIDSKGHIDWEGARQAAWSTLSDECRHSMYGHHAQGQANHMKTTGGQPMMQRRFSIVDSPYPMDQAQMAASQVQDSQGGRDDLALIVFEVDGVDHFGPAKSEAQEYQRTKYRRTMTADGSLLDEVNPYENRAVKSGFWLVIDART
ncbi:hypothetical protein BC832DRAFT_545102 [Gaertneriomyces semiglobifer]|nr:hypothetical protein BC832DRAFT_545102 [Gaertneriomyces semiglobifer]